MAEEPSAYDTSYLDPASRRVGTVLDAKWTLNRLLGVGGMAAVYAGTHRNGARAAIKLFPFSVTTSPESAERILREGYLANRIGHPAVVRVLDDHLDREEEYAYLVMELLEGETARQRVERTGPMSPLEAARSMIELADCLGAAHDKGVVHRDIKPENLFFTEEGRLKVLDFGVARALDGTSSSVTRTGAMLGTPAYMSPEQARGRPSEVSTRSDIYSAGATLLFLVAGEFLHEGESAQEIMVRAAWTPARKIRERHLGLPDPIADVIDRACAFDPKDRYQTAAEMRVDLESAIAQFADDPAAAEPLFRTSKVPVRGPISTAPLPFGRPTPRSGEMTVADRDRTPEPAEAATQTLRNDQFRRATWWIAGGAGLVAVVAVVGWWTSASNRRANDRGSSQIATPTQMAVEKPQAAPVAAAPTLAPSVAPAPLPKDDAPEPAPAHVVARTHIKTASATRPTTLRTSASAVPARARPPAIVSARVPAPATPAPPLGRDVGY